MKLNVAAIDRLIRIIIGLAIAIVGIIFKSYWGVAGIVLLATGVFGYCPIYGIFKISTAKKSS